ncbi:hypothetical protein [Paenibacillus baekrokdamisoli]|nr:hypothetical protein [Paenibacillus baekrokdamisoli]
MRRINALLPVPIIDRKPFGLSREGEKRVPLLMRTHTSLYVTEII